MIWLVISFILQISSSGKLQSETKMMVSDIFLDFQDSKQHNLELYYACQNEQKHKAFLRLPSYKIPFQLLNGTHFFIL